MSPESEVLMETLSEVKIMMVESDRRTSEPVDYLKSVIDAMGRGMKMGPHMEIQSGCGHRFQYHVPVLIQVGQKQEVGRFEKEYVNGERLIKANCLIDSGASVSLVTEELVESLRVQIVEPGN